MSQIDPRTLELIHSELDGELDGAERAELEARCAADPAARDYRVQWGRINDALARMAPVDPPAGLRRRWQGGSPAAPVRLPAVSRPRRWLRPAIGIAASGLALALALGYGGIGRPLLDGDSMVGTMGGPAAVHSVSVDADGVTGAIALRPTSTGYRLDFDLRSERAAAVSARWEPSAFGLGEIHGAAAGTVQADPGRIAFVVDPAQHLRVDLVPGEGGLVRVRIEGAGESSQELAITVPAAPADR